MLYPALATLVNAGSQYAAYRLGKPKRPQAKSALYLRQLQDTGLQSANQATSNAGMMLAPALSSRGLQRSGVGLRALSGIAGKASQEAVRGTQQGYLSALLEDRRAVDDYNAQRAAARANMISGIGSSLGANVSGYGAVRETGEQERKTLELLKQIYSPEEFSLYFGSSAL